VTQYGSIRKNTWAPRRSDPAWSVVCFVVRPGFRRRGLMHHLLDGAVEHAHAMGATALEGYPVDPGSERIDQISGYVGTVQFFEAHRFNRVRQTAGRRGGKPRWLVRRQLP
jgi:GNAT superfamily N-acetyltransferase